MWFIQLYFFSFIASWFVFFWCLICSLHFCAGFPSCQWSYLVCSSYTPFAFIFGFLFVFFGSWGSCACWRFVAWIIRSLSCFTWVWLCVWLLLAFLHFLICISSFFSFLLIVVLFYLWPLCLYSWFVNCCFAVCLSSSSSSFFIVWIGFPSFFFVFYMSYQYLWPVDSYGYFALPCGLYCLCFAIYVFVGFHSIFFFFFCYVDFLFFQSCLWVVSTRFWCYVGYYLIYSAEYGYSWLALFIAGELPSGEFGMVWSLWVRFLWHEAGCVR